ncbi:MAG: dTDP-4-amino-4,6-dideoxygalactose transaminase, partial [Candidatus Eremiobacteraeota bacterium]|nr:dTDP-4-amino-4,6-dideoxygalactose transaminase [Candidatus Eremiobacteraeota bacterium]
ARLVFADIRPDTLNLDEVHLESLITERTRAIVVVHYGGIACEMDSIMATASRHKIPVIEDNAHGLFAKYRGVYLGTFGALATQSFHETKNFTCGEGGALLINDSDLIERAEIIREKGTNRRRFLRGEVDKYTWVALGSSYLPSDILAAHLYAQLEARNEIQSRRKTIWDAYYDGLATWAEKYEFQRPHVPAGCEQGYHTFYLLAPNERERDALIGLLRARGISSVFHYSPLHRSEMGRRVAARHTDCAVTESVSARLLRLPFYYSLSDEDQERVIAAVQSHRS